MKRILPFPHRPIPMTKVWNDDEKDAVGIADPIDEARKARAVADFTRIVEQTGILNPCTPIRQEP